MSEKTLEQRILELENKVVILNQLAEISASLNAQIDLQPLLKHIMDVAVSIVNCEACSVLLWDKNKQQLVFAASTTVDHTDTSLIGLPVPMDSIAGDIFQNNRVVQAEDTSLHPMHYEKVDKDIKFKTRSLLGVPMRYKNKVIGVLEAINKRNPPWDNDDRHYLDIIASQAAVAIEGAQLVADLRQANQDLNEVDKLKNDFIAIASHELRTPLGVIMGYASFLQEEESESAKEHAGKVLESALKLRKIIEDMVNLRYIKQNQADLHLEEIDTNTLLKGIKQEVSMLLDVSKHNFKTVELDEPPVLNIDQTRMMMALSNVMHNAFSFTPPSGTITLGAVKVSRHEVHIRVADTGKGIEEHQLGKIFEEFYQIEDHMTRKHGGLGIGLSIARAIVTAHSGRIWAESDGLGNGTTFVIALPTKDAPGLI
jgi:signal transduction histidine kinase